MNMRLRLTEEKLKDMRFHKKEEAIFEAFFDGCGSERLSVNELAGRAGVDKATFYRHHPIVYEIVKDYEGYILDKYIRLIQRIREREDINLRKIYYETIVFVLQNKRVFKALIEKGELKVIERMILILEPEIIDFVGLSDGCKRFLRVYGGEIVGLITDWGMDGLKEVRMTRLLNDMMYLSETAKIRLLPLVN